MENYVGKRLDGRYEVQEIIGVGGMSVVYKAYDNIDDRVVAVKILKDEFAKNEDFKRRFKNESKVIALLSHPNIVKVYDVNFGERLQYIVMEYIDGITLKEYINKQGAITWNDALFFMTQILKAVQHAHDKGIVHRDIKPQNIILLANGNIKVADFGIARFSRSDTKTLTEEAIGSVHYIAPEQAKGEPTDEKADIYSLGVVLYEMLSGLVPFDADSAISVALMHVQADPKRLTEINPEIPMGLEQICAHAMQKNPLDRYQTANEMLIDIERIIKKPTVRFNYSLQVTTTRNSLSKTFFLHQKTLREYLVSTDNGYLTWNEIGHSYLMLLFSFEKKIKKGITYSYISPDTLYIDNTKKITYFEKTELCPGYVAIEQYDDSFNSSEVSMVYSVAATLYRILVGTNPPDSKDRKVNDKLMIPNSIAVNIPMCVIKAMGGALQVDPSNRIKTIKDFRLMLEDRKVKSTPIVNSKIFGIFRKKEAIFTAKSSNEIEPYCGNKKYIFISYSHKNENEVYDIIEHLQNQGYRIWFDNGGIPPGSEYDKIISEKVLGCEYLLAFVNNYYIQSRYCKKELMFADRYNKNILLIYLSPTKLPSEMDLHFGHLQNIQKYNYNDESGFYRELTKTRGLDKCKEL